MMYNKTIEMNEILYSAIESDDIREYLEQLYEEDNIDPVLIKDIICGAPVSLDDKHSLLRCIEDCYPDNAEVSSAKRKLEDAICSMKHSGNNERFTVENKWFDPDIYEEKDYLVGVYDNIDEALSGIRDNMEYEQDGESIPDDLDDWAGTDWYEIKKWEKSANGYDNTYIYYHDGTDIRWFEGKEDASDRINGFTKCSDFLNSSGLRLYPEYKAGDMLSVDCRPFRPRTVVEVLENDLGGLWVRFKSEENKIDECYLHNLGLILYPINPLSPFYRIKKIM